MFFAALAFVQLQAVRSSYRLLLTGNSLALTLNPVSEILQEAGDVGIQLEPLGALLCSHSTHITRMHLH